MTPTLETLYRALLVAYPRDYRRARGDEIVGTLLDAAWPGQRLPAPREAGGLIAGGLRTRALEGGADVWRRALPDGLRIGAVLLLGAQLMDAIPESFYGSAIRPHLLPLALALTIVVVMRRPGWYGIGLVAVDVALAWPSDAFGRGLPDAGAWIQPFAACTLAAASFAWSSSAGLGARPWSWPLVGGVLAGLAVLELAMFRGPFAPLPVGLALALIAAPALALVSLIARDARLSLGATIYLAATGIAALAAVLAAGPAPFLHDGGHLTVWAMGPAPHLTGGDDEVVTVTGLAATSWAVLSVLAATTLAASKVSSRRRGSP